MNRNYSKDAIDKLLDNQPEVTSDSGLQQEAVSYPNGSNTRSLLLIMADGNQKFFNYSYLISGDYLKSEGCIRLEFTTHIVLLKGLQLDRLYEALFEHRVRVIVCRDEQYNVLDGDDEGFVVNGMVVEA